MEREVLPKEYIFIFFSFLFGGISLLNNRQPIQLDRLAVVLVFFVLYLVLVSVFSSPSVLEILSLIGFTEFHTFEIEQKSTGAKKDLHTTDFGGGIGYQFFVWKGLYVQPAVHVYLRKDKSLNFDDVEYKIPNVDLSPVIRIGYRLWSK